ncbi:Heavy metal RND efflux outer membrane protein, CzcC family protein [Enhygromyxa salina]|uniref:Heavy metal RND efflux outer membrane protein, CzcC family protein n=1 Tax=Enhygromyxa salina TaxID=215803 RepID=A0A0C1ZTT2_9BACT|nr:TolC family protein [Enhygromyxa salina]KIG14463.1 Heavy metal RND efflux outer membrane protein, CzcC family protein [Enhygromyxa salina]
MLENSLLQGDTTGARGARSRSRANTTLAGVLVVGLSTACAGSAQRSMQAELERAGVGLAAVPQAGSNAPLGNEGAASELPRFDGTPEPYVTYALVQSHELRASWERWRAATHRVARERRMPSPTLTYAVFVSPVETRVGPQRHRLGVHQRFPWPGELLAGADAATAAARVEQRKFEAAALELRARVLVAYWQLWTLREIEVVEREQLELYESLIEIARGRLEVGQASLANVQQLELGRARLADQIDGLREAQRAAQAALLGAVAAPPDTPTPTTSQLPTLVQPRASEASLRQALVDHPSLGRWQAQAEVGDLRVKEARHARAPGFSVGVDWVEVGPARMDNVADSGKDAVSISVGLELPLWQRNYAEDQRAAQADAAAARAEWAATRDRATAQLGAALSQIRDTARRAALHEDTLIPQAQSALESTLGGYATGDVQFAAILLAERELLELRLAAVQLHAQHAIAWADLEAIVGRSVAGQSAAQPQDPRPEADKP